MSLIAQVAQHEQQGFKCNSDTPDCKNISIAGKATMELNIGVRNTTGYNLATTKLLARTGYSSKYGSQWKKIMDHQANVHSSNGVMFSMNPEYVAEKLGLSVGELAKAGIQLRVKVKSEALGGGKTASCGIMEAKDDGDGWIFKQYDKSTWLKAGAGSVHMSKSAGTSNDVKCGYWYAKGN